MKQIFILIQAMDYPGDLRKLIKTGAKKGFKLGAICVSVTSTIT